MNSVLQALYFCQPFRQAVLKQQLHKVQRPAPPAATPPPMLESPCPPTSYPVSHWGSFCPPTRGCEQYAVVGLGAVCVLCHWVFVSAKQH